MIEILSESLNWSMKSVIMIEDSNMLSLEYEVSSSLNCILNVW